MDINIPEGMTDAAMLALVIGFLSPLVLNFIVSATWPAWAKSLAAFAFAAVAGIITAWVTGAFEGLSILSTVLVILVVSITSYQNFWKQVAPGMQRGSNEKAVQDEAAKKAEIVEVAAPVAANVAQQVVNDQTVLPEAENPTAEGAVG